MNECIQVLSKNVYLSWKEQRKIGKAWNIGVAENEENRVPAMNFCLPKTLKISAETRSPYTALSP